MFATARLSSRLNDSLVFPHGSYHALSLKHVMSIRFPHIDIFARLASCNRVDCMPVVRGTDHQDVDRLVVDQASKVTVSFGLFAIDLRDCRLGSWNATTVNICHRH